MVAQIRSWYGRNPAIALALVGLLAVAVVLGVRLMTASAATATLHPDAIATDSADWLSSSGNKVTDVSATDATNFVYLDARNSTEEIIFSVANGSAAWSINGVTMYVVASDLDSRGITANAYVGGSLLDSVSGSPGSTYVTYSKVLATPSGGWTPTNLATLQVGLTPTNKANTTTRLRVDEVYFVVDYSLSTLTVSGANDTGVPTTKVFGGVGDQIAVDRLTLTATDGNATVDQIMVRGLDTADSLTTDVTGVSLWRDDDDGAFDAGDTQVGTTQTFSGAASGSTATFGSLAYSVNVGTPADLWVVYDVGASAVHGHVVGSQLVDGDIDSAATVTFAATPITSGASGQTVEIDASVDTITLTDPLNSAVLTGPTKIIAGTAADLGSGLSAVEVQIIRDGTEYWNGTAWVGTAIWATATVGTPPNWTYSWALDSGQNAGDHTYTVAARATDNFANVKTSPVSTSITVDNTGPTMVSAVALDTSHVDVVFSEDLDGASIAAGDFTIAGISVTAAVLDGTDSTLVHLTTSAQGSGTSYTAQSAAGQVEDLAGNANLLTSANFTGFTPDPALSVSGGNNTGVPTTLVYRDRDARIAVDRLTFTAVDGSVNVTQIVVRGFDTVGALTTDITGVSLWEDDGDETFDDASDTQIGTTQTFSGDTSGSTATFGSLTYSASVGASDIWVVYDIGAAAVDGHIVGSQLIDGDVTVTGPATVTFTATPISSAGSTAGQTVQIDAQNPIADTSDPLSSAVLTGSTKQISGTAADAGSGLSSVDVRIRRDGTDYWNGSAWVGAETWNAATGTTNWAYDWPLDSGQNSGDHAYVITARATDNVARTFTDATPVNAVTVDNTGPAMVSAIALDDTHADVVFSEDLDGASIAAGDFTIAGISVTAAVLDGTDSTLVHLTTSAQGSGTSYTVQAAAGLVDDAYGNGNALTSANFTGFADAGTLSVSQGADAGHPSTQQDIGVSTVAVVDELVWSASGGDVTVGQVVVRGLDTGNALTSNISAVRLFVDNGDGVFVDGPDVQLGSTQTFAVDASGSTVTFGSLGYVVPDGLSRDVWIVYTVSAAAADGDTLGSRVDNGDITAATGSVNGFTDVISADAGQTLAVDAANPAADTTDPLSSATLTGLTKQISGTASDGTGSGIDSVVVSIARSGGTFWNGSAWVGVEVWNVAAGTANWTYDWALDAGQNSDYTYTITARATDNVGLIGTDLTPVTNVTVDNEGPSIASASALDTTTVDVVFDEDLDPATIAPSGVDVSIPGLTVSAAVLQGDSRTLRLTTSAQVPGQSYTAAVAEGNVTDVLSNAGLVSSAGFLGYGATSDTTPPSIPSSVEATSGALPPTVALATWAASSDDVGVSGYKVWRSLTTNGIYVALGTTTGLSFSDDTGIPGEDYYYKVTAFDASGNVSGFSSVAGPIIATWTQAPHATYSVGGNLCRLCHDPHEAAIQSSLMRNTGDEPTESSVCFACHDGQGASTNIKAGADNSFALASGHSLEETSTMPDLTNRCSSCHGPHSNYNGLPFLPKSSVNGVSVTSADNTWCLACHNDTNDWYGAGYPPAATPTRDAIGYPVSGTFPGETTYADPTANAHVSIPASATAETVAGDCLYCHAAHRGANDYDGLNEEYRPTSAATLADDQANGTYAESCFTCHGGTLRSEFTTMPVDIKQFVTAGSLNAGHRIKTAGGTLPVGAPLPCYDCHNPHGSTRGNSSLLADELGQSLDTTSDAGVRSLCFSCHTSSDAKIWESVTTTYTTVGIQTFEGLRRNGGDGSALLLPSNTGHASTDTESCYQCHGDNYTSSGFNVHNPTGGISTGGSGCYACHGVYQPNMEDSAGAKIGAASTTVYHHVLGGAAGDGDIAPHNAPYPTSTSDVYCVSCHSDHNHFNSSPGANLRLDIADTDGSTTADSDFSTSAPYGICVSCHSVSMTKDTTNQLDDGTTAVQPIDGAAFDVSAHQYTVSSEFGAGNTFNADCSKCHNDEQTKDFQTSTYSFGTHYSAARRLLSAFGATVSDPLEENHCYECHAPVGSYPGAKTVSNQDWYGVSGAVMDDPSEYVYESIEDLGGSSHPIKATAGGTVECESCHNPHMVQSSAGNRVTDPDNTLNLAAYTTAAEQAAFCIKCHDGTPPVYTSNPTTYVPYAVTLADVADDKTTYAARGHWSPSGSISAAEIEACSSCHDNHGSAAPKLLGEYDSAVGGNAIRTTDITANDNTVCFACHTAASTSFPALEAQREAVTGYLTDGTWPGMAAYSTAYTAVTHTGNGHLTADGGVAGTALPGYVAGDCKVCHDVHGTANTYDELRLGFGDQDYTLCLDCHDADGPAGADIERFYPAATGGSNAGDRSGHRIVSSAPGAMLVAGEALPCYDCHNPHGSESAYMLQVGSVGDDTGEINLTTPLGVRNFCFTCHTTADGSRGYNGSGMVVISAGTEVEGIDRASTSYRLRLPAVSGHNDADTTSCYGCHGNDYSAADSQNVHNPGPGESAGGTDCFDCHDYTDMQSSTSYHHYMTSDSAASYPVVADPSTLTATDAARTCLSCHVDHDYFSPNFNADAAHTDGRAQNLRSSISAAPSISDGTTYLSADYDNAAAGDGGVCISCHKAQMTKNTTGRETAGDRSTQTLPITSTGYASTAHDYFLSATGLGHEGATFASDSSDFGVNCAKCHNDEQAKLFQSGTNEFGVHDSSKQRILTALGQANVPTDSQEELCYLCHSRAFEAEPRNPNGGASYTAAATADAYGALDSTGMFDWSVNVKGSFTNAAIVSQHPVAGDGSTTARVECLNCHNIHKTQADLGFFGDGVAQDPDNTLLAVSEGDAVAFYSSPSSDTERKTNRDYCLTCHDGTTPGYVNNGTAYVPYDVFIPAADAADMNKNAYVSKSHFNNVAGDTGATAVTIDQTCGDCHDTHGSTLPALLGPSNGEDILGTREINLTAVTGNNNTICQACHDGATTNYPQPTTFANGYPELGTWPGFTVYNTARNATSRTGNGHLSAVGGGNTSLPGYAAGDCKTCHDVHGTAEDYDELRLSFTPTDFTLCFDCHDADGDASRNIKTYYPGAVGGAGGGTGHYIQTAGGTLGVNDTMPCYDCHNPHGTANTSFGLQIVTMTDSSTTIVVGDAANEILMSPANQATASNVRNFCFICHTTANTTKGWNGSALTVVGLGATVEGLDRTTGTLLKLPSVTGHNELDPQSCYLCHGSDYSGLSTNNVHNPSGGVSNGGSDCYSCHTAYQAAMEDQLLTDKGTLATSQSTYHHVMGSASNEGDNAFAAVSYPAAGTDVYCMSCHVDHDTFNLDKAGNLRESMSNELASSTDYDSTANAGVCTDCHASSLTKDAANLADSAGSTPIIADGAAANEFGASAHDYYATSTYGDATTFNANCSKCHNDEATKDFQTSSIRFGTHFSAASRILSALGGTVADQLQENHCYRCHSETTDGLVGTDKSVANRDWYDKADMTTSGTEEVYQQFQLASKHPVVAAGGNSVECESCHNAHVVSAASRVTDPNNTYNPDAYTNATDQAAFCLTCHDGGTPSRTVDGLTYIPYDVTIAAADAAAMNKDDSAPAIVSKGHWTDNSAAGGSIGSGEEVACGDCHDNHGSDAPMLLGLYNPATGNNEIGAQTIDASDNKVCKGCHTSASTNYPATDAHRDSTTGYLTSGVWPGSTIYEGADGIHKGASVVFPSSGLVGGDCKNCHEPHGTDNAYDMLVDTFDHDDYTLCFDCHDATGPAATDIAALYTVASGGTSTDALSGHQVTSDTSALSGNTLAKDDAVPCFNCHNPHGSASAYGLQVRDIGDSDDPFDLSDGAGVREFCFTCHSTSDTTEGWDGGGWETAVGLDVEGIPRDDLSYALRLPVLGLDHTKANTGDCLGCHADPHLLSGGGSSGGVDCYACHEGKQQLKTYMEDQLLTDKGTAAQSGTTYHHVMGSASSDGDAAFSSGNYPDTAGTDVYCMSCHVDHDTFNSDMGTNLRAGLSNETSANTDFNSTSNVGVCTDCHAGARTKDVANQKVGGSSATPIVDDTEFGASQHDYYVNSTFGDTSSFQANCVKCHNDDASSISGSYTTHQTSTNKFGLHYSSEDRIAIALGAVKTGTSTSTEENLCYECHTGASAGNDGYNSKAMSARTRGIETQFSKTYTHGVDTYSGLHAADEYTNAPATVNGSTTDGWWGSSSTDKHVECEDCHNPHEARDASNVFPDDANTRAANTAVPISNANLGVWGVNITNPNAGSDGAPTQPIYEKVTEASYEWQMCLKCHSIYAWGTNASPAVPSGQSKSVSVGSSTRAAANMTDVGLDFNTNHYAYHPLFAAGRNQPPTNANSGWTASGIARQNATTIGLANTMTDGWLTTSLVTCSDCHGNDDWSSTASRGPHGSDQPWILRGVNTGIKVTLHTGGTATPNASAPSGSGNVCLNCHRADVYGYGDGSGPGTDDDSLSRQGHLGGGMAAKCGNGADLPWAPVESGCYLCHGGRGDDGTQAVGVAHGSSMGQGDATSDAADGNDVQDGTLSGDEMGKRFMNGAGWDHHVLGDSSGSIGCSTVNTANQYSSCSNHRGASAKTATPEYYYQWQ